MRKHELYLPQVALIAGTRAMAGLGLGLLIAPRLKDEHRKAVGWTLLAIGAMSTIPLGMQLFAHDDEPEEMQNSRESDELRRHDALAR